MRKYFFVIISLLLICLSCNKKAITLVDDLNNAVTSNETSICDSIPNTFGRNIVYLFTDLSCSKCIIDYISFIHTIEKYDCKYDTIITIAGGEKDILKVNSFYNKYKIKHPQQEIIIPDFDNSLTNKFFEISHNNNILLFEKNKLIFYSSINFYYYDDNKGFIKITKY